MMGVKGPEASKLSRQPTAFTNIFLRVKDDLELGVTIRECRKLTAMPSLQSTDL